MEEELDFTKLKYALYLRKSTDDIERQVRSLPDQKVECMQLAERLHLHILEVIEEKNLQRSLTIDHFLQDS